MGKVDHVLNPKIILGYSCLDHEKMEQLQEQLQAERFIKKGMAKEIHSLKMIQEKSITRAHVCIVCIFVEAEGMTKFQLKAEQEQNDIAQPRPDEQTVSVTMADIGTQCTTYDNLSGNIVLSGAVHDINEGRATNVIIL